MWTNNFNVHLLKGLEEFDLSDMERWPNWYIQDQSLLAVLDQPDKSTIFFMIIRLYAQFNLHKW